MQTRETLSAEEARELLGRAPAWSLEHVPTAARGGRARRGVRRADPPRRVAPARAQHVDRQRQPAQGRGHERGPDRRAARRARGSAPSVATPDELYEVMRCAPSTRRFTDESVPRGVLRARARERPLCPQRRQPPGVAGDRRHRSRYPTAHARALRASPGAPTPSRRAPARCSRSAIPGQIPAGRLRMLRARRRVLAHVRPSSGSPA